MKLDHQLTQYTRINPRWIKDLNISCDTIKVLEENTGSKIFTDISPMAKEIKEKINKWVYIKAKIFCTEKENIKMKREPTIWENIPIFCQ